MTLPVATDVQVSDRMLHVQLRDGSWVSQPLAWWPRLRDATPEQLADWRMIDDGRAIQWPALYQFVTVSQLLGPSP